MKQTVIKELSIYVDKTAEIKARLEDLQARLNATLPVINRLNLDIQYLLKALKEN